MMAKAFDDSLLRFEFEYINNDGEPRLVRCYKSPGVGSYLAYVIYKIKIDVEPQWAFGQMKPFGVYSSDTDVGELEKQLKAYFEVK